MNKGALTRWCALGIASAATVVALATFTLDTTTYAAPPAPLVITDTPEPPTRTPTSVITETPTNTPEPIITPTTPPVGPGPGGSSTPTVTPVGPTPSVPTEVPTATPTERPSNNKQPTPFADPAIVKSTSCDTVGPNNEVTFTLRVTNQGNAAAENVVVTDDIPSYFDLLGADASRGTVSTNDQQVSVSLGTVAPSEEVSISVRVRTNSQITPPLALNTAQLSTTSRTNSSGNDVATASVAVVEYDKACNVAPATPTTPAATPTAPAATPVIPSEPTAVPAVPVVPTPSPRVPSRLPNTGDSTGTMGAVALFVALGLMAVGLLLRRRV